VLTLQEALDYTNNATWDWENLLDINLQMRTKDYDPTADLTLDSSGNGTHFTLGNGAGVSEPVQGKGRMIFAGAEYLERLAVAQPAGAFTAAGVIANRSGAATTYLAGSAVDGADTAWLLNRHSTGPWRFYVGSVAGYVNSVSHLRDDAISVVGVWDGTTARLYINGVLDVAGTTGVPAQPAGGDCITALGRAPWAGSDTTGDIFDFKYRDGQAWTPTQILDYHRSQMAVIGSQV